MKNVVVFLLDQQYAMEDNANLTGDLLHRPGRLLHRHAMQLRC